MASASETQAPSPQLRRAARFAAREALWRVSSIERVRECGHQVVSADGVHVVATGTGTDRRAGFSGLSSCGSTWSCTVCSAKIAAERASEIEAAILAWERGGGVVHLATFTMRHRLGQPLAGLWDAVAAGWGAATSGKAWVQAQRDYGSPFQRVWKSGERAGLVQSVHRIGTVRYVEVTCGPNGWHVHVHCLLFMPAAAAAEPVAAAMFARWAAAIRRRGYSSPLRDSGGLDVRRCTGPDAAELLGGYFAKHTFDSAVTAAGRAAREVARGDLKSGKSGHRTPFQLLHDFITTGDSADLELWHEWEQASRGRRQVAWSVGLREFVQLAAERTDEEIAEADDLAGEPLVRFPNWWQVRSVPGLMIQILELAEADDTGLALAAWLDGAGLDHAPPRRTAPAAA